MAVNPCPKPSAWALKPASDRPRSLWRLRRLLVVLSCLLLVGALVPSVAFADPIVINPWEDAHQDPVLPTLTDPGPINPSAWFEYDFGGPSPIVMGHTSNTSLPVMRFFAPVPNGMYEVSALLWAEPDRTYRYYYSFSASNPEHSFRDISGPSGLTPVPLGSVGVNDGQFTLYTRRADMIAGPDWYTGWGPITLTPVETVPTTSTPAASPWAIGLAAAAGLGLIWRHRRSAA